MDKRQALRLKPGDKIVYGHSARSIDMTWDDTGYHTGEVVLVTLNGGIKVRNIKRQRREFAEQPVSGTAWVPYHHALRPDWCR